MSGFPWFYVTIENVAALGSIGCKVSMEKVVKAHLEAYKRLPGCSLQV